MASGQLSYVLSRGRAYRCVSCGYVEGKSRAELHFYTQHVVDSEIPFTCVPCDFKTGSKKKLDTHLESPGHREKLGTGLDGLEVINSQTPRYIEVGRDIVRMSRDDSARHWIGVSRTEGLQDGDVLEDLRPQLLGQGEEMVLTPKRVELKVPEKTLTHRETQTEPMSLDRIEEKIESLKGDMTNCITHMYTYMEQLKELNGLQEVVIQKVEERLDKLQRDDKRGEDRDRRRREVPRERRRERSRSRERR